MLLVDPDLGWPRAGGRGSAWVREAVEARCVPLRAHIMGAAGGAGLLARVLP